MVVSQKLGAHRIGTSGQAPTRGATIFIFVAIFVVLSSGGEGHDNLQK
jgi:hypothetical protein